MFIKNSTVKDLKQGLKACLNYCSSLSLGQVKLQKKVIELEQKIETLLVAVNGGLVTVEQQVDDQRDPTTAAPYTER